MAEARRTLQREFGLHVISPSNLWLVPAEIRLREQLAELEPSTARIESLQRQIDQQIEQNRAVWQAAQQQIAALKVAMAPLNSGDKIRREIQQQIDRIRARTTPPDELGTVPEVRRTLIDLTNARLELTIDLMELRRTLPTIGEQYEPLQKNPRVRAALQTLGSSHRLGPVKEDYSNELRRMESAERTVLTDWSPLYLQSGQPRVGAILQERLPVTFTWQSSAGPTLLTTSVAEASGLSAVNADSGSILAVDRRRRVTVRSVTIAQLRFGRHVFENVAALVLPPEAEDVGCRIGRDAFAGLQVAVEPERLRLVITESN